MVERRGGLLCVDWGVRGGADGGNELVGAGARGLDVFCALFEDVFEADANVGEFALEEEHDL